MLAIIVPTPGKYPKGPDCALRWPDGFALSYWDLWFLLALKEKFKFDSALLEKFLVAHLDPESKSTRSDDWFKKLCHWRDLKVRVPDAGRAITLLAQSPGKLLKKETKKGIERVVSEYIMDAPSPAMLNNPRDLLKRQARRGLWSQYPTDPGAVYERQKYEFRLPGERGYFSLDHTFRLSRDVERAYEGEIEAANTAADRLAVTRAFVALMLRNADSWDDSCGAMSGTFEGLYENWLKTDLQKVGLAPEVFYQDLLWNYVFDDYCLCSSNHRELTRLLQPLDELTKQMIREKMADFERQLREVYEWYSISRIKEFDRALNGITDRYHFGGCEES